MDEELKDLDVKKIPGRITMHTRNVKEDLINCFGDIVDNVEEADFSELWNKLKTPINRDDIINQFKSKLVEKIKLDFDNIWAMNDVELNLSILECLKERKKSNEPKWRPTSKSVEDQVKPFVVIQQNAKIDYLKECIAKEREEIVKMESVIEKERHLIREMIADRSILNDDVVKESKQLLQDFEELRNIKTNCMKFDTLH